MNPYRQPGCGRYPRPEPAPVRPPEISPGCEGDMKAFPLAMAFVPVQSFVNLKSPRDALRCGTLFCDLYLDFYGRRCS